MGQLQPPRRKKCRKRTTPPHGITPRGDTLMASGKQKRESLLHRVIAFIRRGFLPDSQHLRTAFGRGPSHQDRLHDLRFRLESILAELDELGLERSAIDICTALERIKAQITDCAAPDQAGEDSLS